MYFLLFFFVYIGIIAPPQWPHLRIPLSGAIVSMRWALSVVGGPSRRKSCVFFQMASLMSKRPISHPELS